MDSRERKQGWHLGGTERGANKSAERRGRIASDPPRSITSSCLSAPALSSRRAAFNNCFDAAAFSEPSASGSAAALGTCVTSQQTLIQYFGRTIGALPSCCFCSRIAPEESTAVRIARSCSCVLLDFWANAFSLQQAWFSRHKYKQAWFSENNHEFVELRMF